MNQPATHARSRARKKARPAWAWSLPAAMVLAAAAIPLLVWYAASAILNSTDGSLTQTATDPTAPGYEVLVVPSPSHMVLTLDPSGRLSAVAILSLASNDQGGTALFLPAETLAPFDGTLRRLVDVFTTEGEEATRLAIATLMDINVDDLTVLDAAGWAQLVSPVAPITVELAADLVLAPQDDAPAVGFPAGTNELTAARTAEFLGWLNPDEPLGTRLTRQIDFWKSWVAAIVASTDPAAVPGEASTGIGRMLRAFASGQVVMDSISGTEVVGPEGSPAIEIDQAELRGRVAGMIPFPRPVVEGARPRVRLLDGVGGLDIAGVYAQDLVGLGAQIVILGNAVNFDVTRTVVVYHDERFADQATAFSDRLGQAVIEFDPVNDAVLDVTIIIGSDQGLALGE